MRRSTPESRAAQARLAAAAREASTAKISAERNPLYEAWYAEKAEAEAAARAEYERELYIAALMHLPARPDGLSADQAARARMALESHIVGDE